MKTFLLDITNRYRFFDEKLDVKAVLCNKSWQVFNDSGEKEIYIFQRNGSLIISLNGKVNRSTWQYIPANHSLIINSDNESYMLRPFFQDENLFTLQLDGTQEYSFLINEAHLASFPVKSLSDLKFYLEHKEEFLYQIQAEKERQIVIQQREQEQMAEKEREQKRRIALKQKEREKRLQAFIKVNLLKDKYLSELKQMEEKSMRYILSACFFSIIGLIIVCIYPSRWIATVIAFLFLIATQIYSSKLHNKKEKYREKATKLLTEEFNRKYPEKEELG